MALYVGFDPTADSLHIGNLVAAAAAAPLPARRPPPDRARRRGHGDDRRPGRAQRGAQPARRRDARAATSPAIKAQLAAFLDFEPGPCQARLVDNRDWTEPLGVLDFLRDVGKHITVNYMLAKESVRSRVASEHGISFTEFSYMLLQANDYAWLHEHLDCELQVGGSRPVGQHHGRHRPRAQALRRVRPRPDGAARHALGRREVRQERRRGAVARSRTHLALRALPVLRQPPGRRRRALPAAAHAGSGRGHSHRRRRARRALRRSAPVSSAWRGR